MSFMQLQIIQKGALYSCECAKCGITMNTHEFVHMNHNERRDAMQAGTLACDECGSHADPDTFDDWGKQYAGRYSAPGYMDCTDWLYDTNKRRLAREVRRQYG